MALAFTDSRTIDAEGAPQWESYKEYYGSVVPGALSHTLVFDAAEFVRDYLSVKKPDFECQRRAVAAIGVAVGAGCVRGGFARFPHGGGLAAVFAGAVAAWRARGV